MVVALVASSFCIEAQPLPIIPENLKAPASEKLACQTSAEGDQIYTCNGTSWVLTGPDAKLPDETGKQIGSHFAGPTWKWTDGSSVTGKPIANATPDAESIPWLLLTAIDHQGKGSMEQVTSIQRLSTKGSNSPRTGCDEPHKGEMTRAHYTAIYTFYTREQ